MNQMLFIQKPPVNEIKSFTKSKYREIINGKQVHDANIELYRKNNDVLISGHIDDKPIYYDSRQKQNRPTSFRNKKQVSFQNSESSNRHIPIMRDSTPFHLMIRPSLRNTNIMNKTRKKNRKSQTKTKNVKKAEKIRRKTKKNRI